MVILVLLTVIDAVTAFVLVTHATFGWFSTVVVLYHAAYVIIKGLFFIRQLIDIGSLLDIVVGIYMILLAFGIFSHTTITIIATIWLVQKIIFIIGTSIAKIFL